MCPDCAAADEAEKKVVRSREVIFKEEQLLKGNGKLFLEYEEKTSIVHVKNEKQTVHEIKLKNTSSEKEEVVPTTSEEVVEDDVAPTMSREDDSGAGRHYGSFKSTFLERIIGGGIAADNAFPYQIALLVNDEYHCSGSIISVKHVLTAGHCVDRSEPKELKVIVGTNNFKVDDQMYPVFLRHLHENYNRVNLLNDIAVLYIKYGIILSEKVTVIKLSTTQPLAGSAAVVAGWGVTAETSAPVSVVLRNLNVTIKSPSDCVTALNGYPMQSPIMICTEGRILQGPCFGDSGGPLTQANKQYGIVSWSVGCAKGKPIVYTNVANYITWLNKVTENTITT
ncbi:hypothetical protein RN001_014632 [Aquatica leii]|uniref:Peptidase S1 domain-containing protein n=1 Tax=Aquatica leii TaxID=1421715 RepID=A0AAN7P0V2_9COLE|nr:hypothetical protein RN001_014632 [Aquatica leii]